ncbi:hypothetical protein ASD44_02615 [Mesorhizobium sp. Root554]|uniref:YhdP family protein n=1 Tax=unclassified Mesorhizobium TaxID=325217 RepID=UPI0006FCDCD9|nr:MULTISPECIES: DUF3971 domain-containing protein [unclassified Mesorhizobium]KQZ13086.1 hypothetical protein ASD27_02620 [Mesorhizobium sp. Root1471]KQZ35603.1 hypothetical protein ASD44_02615 [Mesorhizobium sp. Root554]
MDQELPRHEKIKFRREEITDLGKMPSACGEPPLGQAAIGRSARILARTFLTVVALVAVAAVALQLIDASGIGASRLREAAEKAIENMAGVDVEVTTGPASITLDGSAFLALQVRDVSLRTATGQPMATVGRMRFGLRLMPLLSGEVRLTSASVSNARLIASALPSGGNDWTGALRSPDGLLNPDKVSDAVFGLANKTLDAVRLNSVREIELDNVEIVLPQQGTVRLVKVAEATVRQTGPGQMQFSSTNEIDGKAMTVAGSAVRDLTSHLITSLEADIAVAASEEGPPAEDGEGSTLGAIGLRLTGSEGSAETAPVLKAQLSLTGAAMDLDRKGRLVANINADATLLRGSNKLDLGRLQISTGRSLLSFQGSFGPKPKAVPNEEPSYRYDLVSDGSSLGPLESPEPVLRFIARAAGVYRVRSATLIADTIALKSDAEGEVLGTASMQFARGKTPGMSLGLNVHDMPVSHAKQLWPWFSASGARRWVLRNLFGGRIVDANLQYQVPPGRIGDGVPLNGNEVFGRFRIEGSRFDTAGRIPPIRDAVGEVAFRGNDVDISLSSGTVYLPSGRTVAASGGTLKVKNANHPPVIGALDIDVAGEAPAIVELASYEPINAMRHVGILPAELSGTVTGNVKADIPLQAGIDASKLNWLVALDYKNLALAKPVDGQMVTEAEGTIVVDPNKAVIGAKALLSGIPAEIDIVEPLLPEGPPRSRNVTMVLDEKTRAAFMPGLSSILSGTVRVALDKNGDGSQAVSADLAAVKLNLPWAGWSKGAGVPAKVKFTMQSSGGSTRLSDFDLSGTTFAVQGSLVLAGGSLSAADFNRVRLNRGDDVSLSLKRTSKGYSISVRGDALDARSLIKQLTADAGTATKGTGSQSVSVQADINSLSGFNDEKLSGFKLDYGATGSSVNTLKASAQTTSGAAITISDGGGGGGNRNLVLKSGDAGAILRFLDTYDHMQGGAIALSLSGAAGGPLRGTIDARDFLIVNEPKLASIVSTTPPGDNRSLNQAVKADIDTSRVAFDRGYAEIEKGNGYLKLANGILRGTSIGATYQGLFYDQDNNMDMTGTFMPAYGLNRIFGEIPIVGMLLGNGRDGGLIGVTFRLRGKVSKPELTINPLSVIAPGIFRSIFEFR